MIRVRHVLNAQQDIIQQKDQKNVLNVQQDIIQQKEQENVLNVQPDIIQQKDQNHVLNVQQDIIQQREQDHVLYVQQEHIRQKDQDHVLNVQQEHIQQKEQLKIQIVKHVNQVSILEKVQLNVQFKRFIFIVEINLNVLLVNMKNLKIMKSFTKIIRQFQKMDLKLIVKLLFSLIHIHQHYLLKSVNSIIKKLLLKVNQDHYIH